VARKKRGHVKHHELPQRARVTKLYLAEDYGFLEGHDELEVYFHRNAVLDEAFDELHIGSLVRYVLAEGEGEAGPQASTVELIGEVGP
jgi:cold shock CspA family protein